ncbi:MAG: peptidoglycan D,D-transpeptidase FtsI family protein [Nocardioides sp.]|uniref:peptidoglycan D,D-transpeptidase FtsI family protein n=1 Tax=Nocardioides sp. TaxID=35761 RepID=UPI003F0BCBB3
MVFSFYGARLIQVQGIDPKSLADLAAAEGAVSVTLPAARGDIVDRNGVKLAGSVQGKMVVADPSLSAQDAPEIATILAEELDLDYAKTLALLRGRTEGSRFEYLARRVPSTQATDTLAKLDEAGYDGVFLEDEPLRDYPGGDVAANLVGMVGTDEPLSGFELTFDKLLSGVDGKATWQSSSSKGVRIPLRESTLKEPKNGQTLSLTIDQDLQWFTQNVLAQTVQQYGAESGAAIVMDPRTGQILALADAPTFDPNKPDEARREDMGSRAISDVYEPGSVAKVLTAASLIDAGKTTPRQRFKVPGQLDRQDRPIGDWWDHGTLRYTLTGIIARSSNIGTVLAADAFSPSELVGYLRKFGLGKRTDIGVRGESGGILESGDTMTSQTKDRVTFGQSMSVNLVQMGSALSTIANDGVRVSPSIVSGTATTDEGKEVGSDLSTSERVVSAKAARDTALMMEKVLDPEDGVAKVAQVQGYRVAGKTGTAQRASEECRCYDGSVTVSFGGFAPADDARLTVYVVVHDPKSVRSGGAVAGPAFSRIMGYALKRYGIAPTGTKPSDLPIEW